MTAYYLDTSVAVRILFGHSPSAATWFDRVTGDPNTLILSSRLLRTELTRALRREGLPVRHRAEILDHLDTVGVDHAVLHEAEAIIPHIRTLDAIHLASALRSGNSELTIVTHDRVMKSVAEQVGFSVFDPVDESADG
ncbi:MAG: type II toxin-antitoxin system VapC family toxin [Microlunatus sp.]